MNLGKGVSFLLLYRRCHSHPAIQTMRAWQTHKYGSPEDLQLNLTAEIPPVTRPTDVLIKVHAASLNPIDAMMLRGYGSSVIGAMRQVSNLSCSNQEFPLTLGRDFSGEVVHTGRSVDSVKPGDEVWGVIGPQSPGSHSEYVVASACHISHKPRSLGHLEASALPYAALTAWAALSTFGGLSKDSAYGKRALVIGASGGVGTAAVQLLRAWGADVTATCSTDAVEMVQNLGANYVIDYTVEDVRSKAQETGRFDFVLDNVGKNMLANASDLLKLQAGGISKYVTVVSPLLSNADQYGIAVGTVLSLAQAVQDSVKSISNGYSLRWAYFIPNGKALKTLSAMADEKEIIPVIDETYEFEEAPLAYSKILSGHARGKTVIKMRV